MNQIYTLPNCPWCIKAKRLMDAMDLEYEEILQKHPDWPTVPYIMLNGKPVGGFTELSKLLRG